MESTRPPDRCAESSRFAQEPLAGTAARADVWIFLEFADKWQAKALESALPDEARSWLQAAEDSLENTRAQLLRRQRRESEPLWLLVAVADEISPRLHHFRLEDYGELAEIDLEAVIDGTAKTPLCQEPLLAVCTHGRRDPCCARHGVPLYKLLAQHLGAGRVVETSHIGGHRFAGTLVLLPHGACFGRLDARADPAEALEVARNALTGEISPAFYRGRSCFPKEVQVAETLVRERTGLSSFEALYLDSASLDGDRAEVAFCDARGHLHTLHLERRLLEGVEILPSCGKEPETSVPVFTETVRIGR